ncbi:glutaminyl-peptide cyclotransferase [Paucibacter sediminis]|uniref:Glutaminyl-peptide cyclotransferase n=1 Tax=Paucibacter sediminis TaxID=3019553 RepID=A0AA95NEN4_9BURK|nr:glutaminyl-peptide cyclotransferase [Paucibacter sp. S2-9]WIT13677.1 glutaminyl-peptide cyclotransferase [Paucibacter sp. S2-9]
MHCLNFKTRFLALLATCLLLATAAATAQRLRLPVYDAVVVNSYPHDPEAFTQGLLWRDGVLYESTGLNGHSSIRKVQLESGRVLQKQDIPQQYFGEGMTAWKDELYSITWQSQVGFVWDLRSFKLKRQFSYPGEGWGLTHDEHHLILSDGTPTLRFFDPASMKEVRRVQVTALGRPVEQLNELEWVEGQIYANIWHSNVIVRIDPASGQVQSLIDLTGLLKPELAGQADVLNGIAYDPAKKRLFVTGKLWPRLFEIRLVPRA